MKIKEQVSHCFGIYFSGWNTNFMYLCITVFMEYGKLPNNQLCFIDWTA